MSFGRVVAFFLAAVAAESSRGATFTVTTPDDTSLRQAITSANALAGPDVITFAPGVAGTIVLTAGELPITDTLRIQGPGASVLTISGNDATRVLFVHGSIEVTIANLTIAHGRNVGYGPLSGGAGIATFDADLTLDHVVLIDHRSDNAGGALIAQRSNVISIVDSTIADSHSSWGGGGAFAEVGKLTIRNSRIERNEGGFAGGVAVQHTGSVVIESSTFAANVELLGGGPGGAWLVGVPTLRIDGATFSDNRSPRFAALVITVGTGIIRNTTISGNTTSGIMFNRSTMTLAHTTVANNRQAGVSVRLDSLVVLANSIVAGNGLEDLRSESGSSFRVRYSAVQRPGTATIADEGGDRFLVDPVLSPLADNGGPTMTHLPAAWSAVIDAGDPAFVPPPATDQRGLPRIAAGAVDMGAVERAASDTSAIPTAHPAMLIALVVLIAFAATIALHSSVP